MTYFSTGRQSLKLVLYLFVVEPSQPTIVLAVSKPISTYSTQKAKSQSNNPKNHLNPFHSALKKHHYHIKQRGNPIINGALNN